MGKKEWNEVRIEFDANDTAIMLSVLNSYARLTPSIESKKNAAAFSASIRAKLREAMATTRV